MLGLFGLAFGAYRELTFSSCGHDHHRRVMPQIFSMVMPADMVRSTFVTHDGNIVDLTPAADLGRQLISNGPDDWRCCAQALRCEPYLLGACRRHIGKADSRITNKYARIAGVLPSNKTECLASILKGS